MESRRLLNDFTFQFREVGRVLCITAFLLKLYLLDVRVPVSQCLRFSMDYYRT